MVNNDTVSSHLAVLRQVGIFAVAVALTGLCLRLYKGQGDQFLPGIVYIFVYVFILASLILYGVLWLVNGYYEISQLVRWLETPAHRPKSPVLLSANVCIVAIGIFFGLLFFHLTNFPIFMGLFSLYVIFDIFYWRVRRVEISKLISERINDIKQDRQSITDKDKIERLNIFEESTNVFTKYYLQRNHYMRVCGEFFVALPLFIISYYHIPLPYGISDIQFIEGGYLLLWIAVFIAEIFVYRWRLEMNKNLAKLEEKLYELDRQLSPPPSSELQP